MNLLKRKKKKKKVVKNKLWEDEKVESSAVNSEMMEDKTTFKYFLRSGFDSFKARFHRPTKIHRIPYFRQIKRLMAFGYFVLFTIAGIMFFNWMSIFFLGVSFVLLDYLYKTRRGF